jgi:PAS domain S-box-containing protein
MMAWLKDTESRLKMINQPYADACGHTVEECIGKTDLDLFPEELATGFMADDREVCSSGQKKQVEERISSLDGIKWHLTYKTPIFDEHGSVIGTTGIAQDITDRKHAEEERERLQMQLTQAQKMEAIGQLAGGVAHDFNNMLGVIIGYSELILEETSPSHQFHAELEEIQKAARRSADLTRQLLTFARKQTVAPKVLDLNQTVEGMLNMLRRLIGENINLIYDHQHACRAGIQVLAAASPWDAIRLAKENEGSIDLLMTDVIMPEMNGRDLAKHLLIISPNIKRLFMSGYTANIIEPHGVLDEGVHFIQKPFSRKDLAAAIRKALES